LPVSLLAEQRQIEASDRPDLGTRRTASNRYAPCDNGANGPPIAVACCSSLVRNGPPRVSFTMSAASSGTAMHVSRIATAVAADRRRSMRSVLPRRS
jgi:hypothetical protein